METRHCILQRFPLRYTQETAPDDSVALVYNVADALTDSRHERTWPSMEGLLHARADDDGKVVGEQAGSLGARSPQLDYPMGGPDNWVAGKIGHCTFIAITKAKAQSLPRRNCWRVHAPH